MRDVLGERDSFREFTRRRDDECNELGPHRFYIERAMRPFFFSLPPPTRGLRLVAQSRTCRVYRKLHERLYSDVSLTALGIEGRVEVALHGA